MKHLAIVIMISLCPIFLKAQLEVDQNNNVGVGTSFPSEKLEVVGNLKIIGETFNKGFESVNTGFSASGLFNRTDRAAMALGGGYHASGIIFDELYDFQIRNTSRSAVESKLISNGNIAFHIQGSSGNIGIGTSTPTKSLEVNGSVQINEDLFLDNINSINNFIKGPSDNRSRIGLGNGGTGTQSWSFFVMKGMEDPADGGVPSTKGQFTCAGRFLDLKYNCAPGNTGTLGLRLNQNGNVGIGTSSPTEKLHVAGNIFTSGSLITSDKRLKKDIVDFNEGLATILRINPVQYKYNGMAKINSDKTHIGVIAQDIKKIAPYMVTQFIHQEHDEFTNKTINEERYLAIDANAILYIAVNAIKEQQQIIEERNQKIDQLEQKYKDLENELIQLKELLKSK